jgi:hypothetical protein
MKDSQETKRSSNAGVTAAPTTNVTERFERGVGMLALYERMRPDQRTAIAGEFIRLLALARDGRTEQLRQKLQNQTQITHDDANELLSADQVDAIDNYVRQRHPEMIAQLVSHPVTQAVLAMPGMPPEDEASAAANKDTSTSTGGDASTSGAAYATSWEQTQRQGEEAAQRVSEDEGTESTDAR